MFFPDLFSPVMMAVTIEERMCADSNLFSPNMKEESIEITSGVLLNANQCPHCYRSYKHQRSLRSHIRHECGKPSSLKCNICGTVFKLKHHLKNHMISRHFDSFTDND